MTEPRQLRPTRRGLLVTGATLALAACDAAADPEPTPSPGAGTSTSTSTATPDQDPDVALVELVREEIAAAAAVVGAARRAQPGLASRVAGYRTLHARHLAALSDDDGGDDGDLEARRPRLRGDQQAVAAAVTSRESRLQRELAEAAVAAQSGPLAALLASMSAAVAQQLAFQEGVVA